MPHTRSFLEQHVQANLTRLDVLLRREVIKFRLEHGTRPDEEFRGLYVSTDDVQQLLDDSRPSVAVPEVHPEDSNLAVLTNALTRMDLNILNIEEQARNANVILPLVRLAQLLELDSFERQAVVIGLAAEVDLKYERLFAYLQDDVTKKRPTVALVVRLLQAPAVSSLTARRYFEPESQLVKWQVISLHDDPGARKPVLLARYIKLDERIVSYLLGSSGCDARLRYQGDCEISRQQELPEDIIGQLAVWGRSWDSWHGKSPVMLFHGRYGSGKRAAATTFGRYLGKPVLMLSAAEIVTGELGLEQGLRMAEREALLTDSLLCLADADRLLRPEPDWQELHTAFMAALASGLVPTVLLAEKPWEPARELSGRPFLRLSLPEPTFGERRFMWATGLDGDGPSMNGEELDALAGRFRLTAGQVGDALLRAKSLAWARDPLNARVLMSDIDEACRGQAQNRLGTLARKLEPRYRWDDIVLPHGQLSTLQLICATVRQRATVYGTWGFDRKLSLSKGLIALFAGPSGTGKTMAAEIIANALGLDVYKIDLASVVSKYIGETEKNLERIFSEAQDSDAILFFDEADALFGKRSEVKDAHDRYANIEIAYLLQRTEEYNGLVILASNVKKNMDEAFVRRLHFIIDFPFPEEPERLEIWRRTFPKQAPLADDINLEFLARKLKIAGGNIRNIILTAAFLAADERRVIAMSHLVRAAGYEYQKMGKLVVEGDFEGYYDLVKV